jgi:hypothetical protein
LGEQRHGGQSRLGADGSAHDEIGLFIQNELFHGQKGLAHRDPGFQVPCIDGLDLEWALFAADIDPAGGVDFLHRQDEAAFGIPAIEKGRGERAPEDNGGFRSRKRGTGQH